MSVEVKELAKQTTVATEDITSKVELIQNNTKAAVTAIEDVGTVINQIDELQTKISEMVYSQTQSSLEISHNVSSAVESVSEVSNNINQSASVVGDISQGLSEISTGVSTVANGVSEAAASITDLNQRIEESSVMTHEANRYVDHIKNNYSEVKEDMNKMMIAAMN